MGVPVLRGGRVVGVMTVQNKTRRRYDDEDVDVLETVAMVLSEMVGSGELVSREELARATASRFCRCDWKGSVLNAGTGMGQAVLHQPRFRVERLVAEDTDLEKLFESGDLALTSYGKPFSVEFGHWFRKRCDDWHCAICWSGAPRRFRGHRPIMAITGHATLSKVERYTRAARQRFPDAPGSASPRNVVPKHRKKQFSWLALRRGLGTPRRNLSDDRRGSAGSARLGRRRRPYRGSRRPESPERPPARMNQIMDPHLKERVHDLDDLAQRLLGHLVGVSDQPFDEELPEHMILVARNMGPAQLMDYGISRLRGLILEEGSPTSMWPSSPGLWTSRLSVGSKTFWTNLNRAKRSLSMATTNWSSCAPATMFGGHTNGRPRPGRKEGRLRRP